MATIVINPGHTGEYNQGICYGYFEGNTMLKLANFLGDILKGMGADVKFTRTTNAENPGLTERGRMAANADLYISLHSNAYEDANVRGVDVFYSVQRPESNSFATDIGNAVAGVMGNRLRRVAAIPSAANPSLDYYEELRAAVSAGARNAFIVEHGFHTNMEDCEFLSNEEALKRIAAAEAAAIARYFGFYLRCLLNYTVQPGDTLYGISHKFRVAWDAIALANGIIAPFTIRIGQQLIIPLPAVTGTECNIVYTVKTGDTLYAIARKYGVAWQSVAMANNIADPYIIRLAQKLIVPLPAGSATNCQFLYTIHPGDSLYSIAGKYGVTWESIASVNEIYYPWTISPGQCVIIPLPRSY